MRRYFSTRFSLWAVIALCLFLSLPLAAQKITGDISGTVTDTSGAVVKDAKVTAVSAGTGETRSATSSDAGFFRILELPPGVYKLTATAPGFKTVTRDAQVAISLVTTSDFQLPVGQISETLQIEDVAPLVETSENRLNTLIESRAVSELPLNGGDFNSLLNIVPGVQRNPGGGFLGVNIDGQRASSNNYAVDGIPNNDRYYGESALNQAAITGTAATLVPLDGISEFAVQSNPGAEFGIRGGSVVNVSLKSGTNAFHGEGNWIRRSDAFDAINRFSDSVTPLRLNQYGGQVTGPIWKDKTFFVVSFSAFRLKDNFPFTADVPTANEIADATACVTTGINPNNSGEGTACLNTGPGPGSDQIVGTADDGTVNSVGQALLNFYPTDPNGKISVQSPNKLDVTGFHFKVDQVFNESNRLSFKYIFGDSLQSQPAGVGELVPAAPNPPDLFNSVAPSRAQLMGLNYTWTISPTKVLESRFGYTRFSQQIRVNNSIDPRSLGLETGPLDSADLGVPPIYYMGYFGSATSGYSAIGGIQGYPITTRPNATYDWQEHFTSIKGNHTVKFGGQMQKAYTASLRNRARAALNFDASQFPTDEDQNNHVLALNELLLGMTNNMGRSFGDTHRFMSQTSAGVYVQDNWKVRPNLTLEFGLRYDITGALGETANRGSNFLPNDPKADAEGFVSLSKQPLYNKDKNNFGPRVGVAWDIYGQGKTVLRGGYTINYDLPNFGTIAAPQLYVGSLSGARTGAFTQPAQGIFSVSIDNSAQAGNTVSSGNPSGFTNPLCDDYVCMAPGVNIFGPGAAPSPPFDALQIVTNLKTPQIHNYNLTLQQQITRNSAFSIAYVGGLGRSLIAFRDLNACPRVVGIPDCDPTQRPFDLAFPTQGLYKHVAQMNNDSFSNYNSLQASYQFRGVHGLSGQANFVWSRSFDTASSNRATGNGGAISPAQNPYDNHANYGPSEHDVPRNFNLSFVYDVPKVHAVPKLLGEGWQVNTIFQAMQGRPFTPYYTNDTSGQDLIFIRADYNGAPIHYDYDNPHQFFDISPFSQPAPGLMGTAGRNMLRGPGLTQWDASIFKNTKIGERFTVQFRWEVFNVLNHPNFSSPTSSLGSLTPGPLNDQIGSTADAAAGSPFIGSGGPRSMDFGIKLSF